MPPAGFELATYRTDSWHIRPLGNADSDEVFRLKSITRSYMYHMNKIIITIHVSNVLRFDVFIQMSVNSKANIDIGKGNADYV